MLRYAALLLVATPAFADPRPLLEGSWEIASAKSKTSREQPLGPQLLKQLPDSVWVRLTLTLNGSDITVGTQLLQKTKGVYTGCTAAGTTSVTWSAKGFTIAAKIVAKSEAVAFKTLTETAADHTGLTCSANLDAETLVVGKEGARTTLSDNKGNVLYLKKIDDAETVDWSKHVTGT